MRSDSKDCVYVGATHFILRKSLMPNHVSSILMKLCFCFHKLKYATAHCYLRIKFCVELMCREALMIFLYFMPKMSFIAVKA